MLKAYLIPDDILNRKILTFEVYSWGDIKIFEYFYRKNALLLQKEAVP